MSTTQDISSVLHETRLFKPPTVGDFVGMGGIGRHRKFSQALAKSMRAAAPGLKVTTKAFGVGRRVPIAQRWREG